MKIPVFVSSPADLKAEQVKMREDLMSLLAEQNIEPRVLSRSGKRGDYYLKEMHAIAKNCHGGVILEFKRPVVDEEPRGGRFQTKGTSRIGEFRFLSDDSGPT